MPGTAKTRWESNALEKKHEKTEKNNQKRKSLLFVAQFVATAVRCSVKLQYNQKRVASGHVVFETAMDGPSVDGGMLTLRICNCTRDM